MAEQTRAERIRTFLKAVIAFNNGAAKVDCVVKNISSTGARLQVTAAIGLPHEFNLQIPHRSESHRAQLMWREQDAIGVHFVPTPAHQTTEAAASSTSALEADNVRLRARIRQLTRRLEDLGQDPSSDDTA